VKDPKKRKRKTHLTSANDATTIVLKTPPQHAYRLVRINANKGLIESITLDKGNISGLVEIKILANA
jgi:hypothetical protein